VANLLKFLDSTTAETIVVEGISSATFSKISKNKQFIKRDPRVIFDGETETLTFTLPSVRHEALHRLLDEAIFIELLSLALRREFVTVGSATYSECDANGDPLWRLEGDSKRKPNSFRGENAFPTLVIEAGMSQRWASLRSKARLWFEKSRGDVRIVLLIRIVDNSNTIWIEKWISTRTRSRTERVSLGVRDREIQILQTPGSNPYDAASYNVVGGPLSLEFNELMLRPPGSGERDLVIDDAGLREYAATFWETMA
jgi:hypothetical protein